MKVTLKLVIEECQNSLKLLEQASEEKDNEVKRRAYVHSFTCLGEALGILRYSSNVLIESIKNEEYFTSLRELRNDLLHYYPCQFHKGNNEILEYGKAIFESCKSSLEENLAMISQIGNLDIIIDQEVKSGKKDSTLYDIKDYIDFTMQEVESIQSALNYPKFDKQILNTYKLNDIKSISPTLAAALENYLHNFCLLSSAIHFAEKYGVDKRLHGKIYEIKENILKKPTEVTGLIPTNYLAPNEIAFIRNATSIRAGIAHPLTAAVQVYDTEEFGKLINESFQINKKYIKPLSAFIEEIFKKRPSLFTRRKELLKNKQEQPLQSAIKDSSTAFIYKQLGSVGHKRPLNLMLAEPDESENKQEPFEKALKISEIESMPTNLQIEGLTYQSIPGQGHCLYIAVGLYLNANQRDLRDIVATHLENNLDEFCGFINLPEGKSIEDYIKDVRNGNEWATNVEIEVLMRVLDRPIIVIEAGNKVTNPKDAQQFKGDPIFVYYNSHNHYDVLLLNTGANGRNILQTLLTGPANIASTQQDMAQFDEPSQESKNSLG